MTGNYLVTILIALLSSTGGWGTLQWLFNRTGRKAEAARQQAEAEKAQSARASLLADAQALAQKTALESSHEAYETVRRQCGACEERLGRAEERIAEYEKRQHEAEKRERKMQAALRAMIRALDKNDPAQVDAAITAARELI